MPELKPSAETGSTSHQLALIGLFSLFSFLLVKLLQLDTMERALSNHWQFLDIETLVAEPIQSLFYLHSQPPMLNAITALLGQFGDSLYLNFLVFNALCTGVVAWVVYRITTDRTPTSKWLPLFFALGYIVFPSSMLYVAYPFYPCMTAMGYALLIYSFHLAQRHESSSLFFFVASAMLLQWTRGSFSLLHLAFYGGLYVLLLRGSNIDYKKMGVVFLLTLIASCAVPAKNLYLYGFFGSSSWGPLNAAKGMGMGSEDDYFISPAKIKELYPELQCKHSYHFQDTADTKLSGGGNYNSCIIIEYAEKVKEEVFSLYDPVIHAKKFIGATFEYYSPSDEYLFLKNRAKIDTYADLVSYAQITVPTYKGFEIRVLIIVLMLVAAWICIRRRDEFIFACLIVVTSHYITHTIIDGTESRRFVFDIEFVFFLLLAALINEFFVGSNPKESKLPNERSIGNT